MTRCRMLKDANRWPQIRHKGRKVHAQPADREIDFASGYAIPQRRSGGSGISLWVLSFGCSPRPWACVPLLGCDLPDFRWQPSGNEVSLFGGNDAHSLPFRNAARCLIGNRLGRSEDGELQNVKPIVRNCVASFTHQPLPLPRQAEPEPAIVIFRSHQADAADDAGGFDPTYPRLDCGKSDVATIRQRAVGWIGPRHTTGQKLHQLPVGKNNLNLFGVGEFEWTQPQPFCFEHGYRWENLVVLLAH